MFLLREAWEIGWKPCRLVCLKMIASGFVFSSRNTDVLKRFVGSLAETETRDSSANRVTIITELDHVFGQASGMNWRVVVQ